ncbi:MAG: DUF5674 family protein [Bacteroidales bacterium]|jgi:hypothetical protein|nr:DUF5674 family protein [Bacteroidales bacterium]
MNIIDNNITIDELKIIAENTFGDLVKAVVDIKQRILVIDAEMHADMEAFLLENGSQQEDIWGINLRPFEDIDNFVEFDSMINIRPRQGNRSIGVGNEEIQLQIKELINNKVVKQ